MMTTTILWQHQAGRQGEKIQEILMTAKPVRLLLAEKSEEESASCITFPHFSCFTAFQ